MAFEAAWSGASGWIAGLVNALPQESVDVFTRAAEGKRGGLAATDRGCGGLEPRLHPPH